jgi:hypothetical protein
MPVRHASRKNAGILLAIAANLAGACHRGVTGPTPPPISVGNSPVSSNTCGDYSVSGVISAFAGGPIPGALVEIVPYAYMPATTTRTGPDGRYSACGPPAQLVGMQVSADGFATAFKFKLPARDQTVDLALQPMFAGTRRGPVQGVIRGDEFEPGDDAFGGACARTACKVVNLDVDLPVPVRAEIRLRWDNPSNQLAIYIPTGSVYFPPENGPPERYCCSSEVIATYAFNGDFNRIAIGFERTALGPPAAADVQAFELTVHPFPLQ